MSQQCRQRNRGPPQMDATHKKTKGPRSANRMSIPWRQGTELGPQPQCLLSHFTRQFLAATGRTRKASFKWQGIQNHVASSMGLRGIGSKRTAGTSLRRAPGNGRLYSTRMANAFVGKTTRMRPNWRWRESNCPMSELQSQALRRTIGRLLRSVKSISRT